MELCRVLQLLAHVMLTEQHEIEVTAIEFVYMWVFIASPREGLYYCEEKNWCTSPTE